MSDNIGEWSGYPYPWRRLKVNGSFTVVGKEPEQVGYMVWRANRRTRRRRFVMRQLDGGRLQVRRVS